MLRSLSPAVSARALAREYGLEELRDYVARSRREIDARRGARLGGRESDRASRLTVSVEGRAFRHENEKEEMAA